MEEKQQNLNPEEQNINENTAVEDELEPSEPLPSMPIILESEVMYHFRYSASKLTLRSSSPKLETLTSNTLQPKSLTLSLQAPIPSSPSPKDSYGLSLTSSAPICQNHNLYTSPLITEQGEHHLKINLFLNPVFLFWKSLFSVLLHISVVGRRYLWESKIANDDSLIFSLSIVPIVRQLWLNYCLKKKVELEHCEGIASVRNIQNKRIFSFSNSIMFKRFYFIIFVSFSRTDKTSAAIITNYENANRI